MAQNKVAVAGATITLTAVGGAKTATTVDCMKGDITVDWGQFASIEDFCHNSNVAQYDKECTATFGETELDIWFTGDKADAMQTNLFAWHRCTGDYDETLTTGGVVGSKKGILKFAFTDVDGTEIAIEGLNMGMTTPIQLKKKLGIKVKIQQTNYPVVT